MKLVSVSHYLHPVHDSEELPAFDSTLKRLCREPYRRIDRFIQLALLGSARCALGQTLKPDCGIYLGSGVGPIGSNVETQIQLIRDREIPKPANFINTLGASAGFYVAKNLGLRGQNHFISRRGSSLLAILRAAMVDLILGISEQVLVGVVEEVALPINEHRFRQGIADKRTLAEGSHWFLLQSDAVGSRTLDMKWFDNYESLKSFVESKWCVSDKVYCTTGTTSHEAGTLRKQFGLEESYGLDNAFHDSPDAAWLAGNAATCKNLKLFLIDGNAERGWCLFYLCT